MTKLDSDPSRKAAADAMSSGVPRRPVAEAPIIARIRSPVNADIPEVDVHFVKYPDTLHNATGARGIGEIGTVGMAAAVANAICNATGVRVRHIPITIEDLLVD